MHLPVETSPFVHSRWIWPVSHHWDIANSYALFRKTFELAKIPSRAPLYITADQSYQLFINGILIARGPARGFQSKWPYDEIDLHSYLKKGKNILAVRAYNPGRSTFQYLTEGFAGLLVAAYWGKIRIFSGPSWKSVRQTSVDRDTVPVSVQLFNQEHVDMRQQQGDWTALGFDDDGWEAPADRPWNGGPWFSLQPRGIPLLDEREIAAGALIGTNEGISAEGYRRVRDVVALRYREDRTHHPIEGPGSPIKILPCPMGQFRSYLLDFGRTVVGHFIVQIERAQGGEIIDTHYAETIDRSTGTPDLRMPTHCRIAIGDRLICRKGAAVHTFYHAYGFRYVTITVRDVPAEFVLSLRFRWIGYPLPRKGSFSSSEPALEKIWEACAWTQQCCSLDAYVDTPWREQAQWWGDARVQAWNTFHLNGDTRLFQRGIDQIAEQTTPDGVTYGHAPTMAHECVLPDFTLIWMLTLWDYFWQTGSTEAFSKHHDTLQKAFAYFRRRTDAKTGLAIYDDRYWLFLDWTDLFKDGAPTVYNLWLLLALEKMAFLYRRSRLPKDAAPLEKWARQLRASLGRLINPEGLLRDGIDRKDRIVSSTSIHSQTLGIIAGLKEIQIDTAFEKVLLPYMRGESHPAATPSAYWITYLFTVLSERGHGEEVVLFIKKHWLPMAEHGTTWENFNPRRGDESFSHAWSAHPLYHLMQTVGGISQSAPGWREITFSPVFHGREGGAVIPTPHGAIQSEWRQKKDSVKVSLRLPRGIRARVLLPGVKPRLISKSSDWTLPISQSR